MKPAESPFGLPLVIGLALATLSSCSRPPRPHVLLVTLDTTRADHIGAYGHPGGLTATIDRLAAEGVLFENAWSPTPLTTPAHASLFTGLYPPTHGVRSNGGRRLSNEAVTLAERFEASGYATAAFVAAYPLTRVFGLAQGFETYDNHLGSDSRGRARHERRASEVTDSALGWLNVQLSGAAAKPIFAWVHYFNPHNPYEPPAPLQGEGYAGEIAYTDHQLGRIVEFLRSRGLLDNTLIVVAADHGEDLGDHGEDFHGYFVYEPTIHVPLVMRGPGLASGERRPDPVSLVDVYPTLVSLAGLETLADSVVQGHDLSGRAPVAVAAPLAQAGPERVIYSESLYASDKFGWAPLHAVRRGGTKWIAVPEPERYDLLADPSEQTNLAGEQPDLDAELLELTARVLVALDQSLLPAGSDLMNAEMLDIMETIGYFGAGSAAGGEPRDPKQGLEDYKRYVRAVELERAGGDERLQALGLLEQLVRSDPSNAEFRLRLARALHRADKQEAALELFEALVEEHPGLYLARIYLSQLYEARGEHTQRRDLWLDFIDEGTADAGVAARLAEVYLDLEQPDEALKVCESSLDTYGPDPQVLALAGQALERLGRREEALDRYRAVLERWPSEARALAPAVALLRSLERAAEARELVRSCLARAPGDAGLKTVAKNMGL